MTWQADCKRESVSITKDGDDSRVTIRDSFYCRKHGCKVATLTFDCVCEQFDATLTPSSGSYDAILNPKEFKQSLTLHYDDAEITFYNVSWPKAQYLISRQCTFIGGFLNRLYRIIRF